MKIILQMEGGERKEETKRGKGRTMDWRLETGDD